MQNGAHRPCAISRQLYGLMVALLCLACSVSSAQSPRIGLVLGGGGARGAAHIGVLKVLEREHIPIHAVTGTSIGAIIGGLYAAGYSPEEIESAVNSLDWTDIFHDGTARPDLPMRQKETDPGILAGLEVGLVEGKLTVPTTLVRGQKLGLFLRRMFLGRSEVATFDDLPIPFRCVATDIGVVQPVVFSSGDLELAVRASMAVPGAFAPVHHAGKVLVDGGIVDNIPIDVARTMGVDHLIVVDVSQPLAPAENVSSSFQILLQMVGGMMRDRTAESLKMLRAGDVLLRPELGQVTSMSFLQANTAIEPGVVAANEALEPLRRLAAPKDQYMAWRALQRQRPRTNPEVAFVRVIDTLSTTSTYVRDRVSAKSGEPLDVAALERDINGAFGRGTYDYISYRLARNESGETGLEVLPLDSALGHTVFRIGAQVSDDFEGHDHYQLNLEARVTALNSKGAEWRTFAGVGRVTTLATDFYVPFGARGAWFADPAVTYEALNQPIVALDTRLAEYRVQSWLGEARVGRDFGDRTRASVSVLRGQDYARIAVGDPFLPDRLFADIGGADATFLWDSLDNVRFPRRGTRVEISYARYARDLGSDVGGRLMRMALDTVLSQGPSTIMFGGRASLASGSVGSFQTQATLGGLTFLSGAGERELIGDDMLLLRTIYYRRLNPQRALISVPVYLGGSLEAGNVWIAPERAKFSDLIGAGSFFLGIDLPIGPLQLGYGHTTDARGAFYLSFGSLVLPRYR